MPTTRTLAILLLTAASATAQSLSLQHGEIVQAVGDPIAALPGATVSSSSGLDIPVIDLNGNMVWRARMVGSPITGNTDDRAIFYGRTSGDIQMVLRSGDPEPTGTMPGVTCNSATSTGPSGNLRISATGEMLVFGCNLSGTGILNSGTTLAGRNDSLIYWGFPSALLVLVQRGDAAPSGGSQYDTSFGNISHQNTGLNAAGVALFKADLVGGDVVAGQNDDAWIIGFPGSLQWMCREGDALLGGAVVVGTIGYQAQIDENGFVLHDQTLSTTLGSTPATAADDKVVLLYSPAGTQTVLLREGDPAPGLAGVFYGTPSLASRAFSRRNQFMIFQCSLTGAVTTTDDSCYVAGTPGNLQIAAREGDPAPTGVAGETYSVIYTSSASINDDGVMCFLAGIAGPSVTSFDNVGIFYGTAGNISMIARGGMAAPDMPAGYIIGTANNAGMSQGTGTPHLNDLGQVLFGCSVWDGVNAATGVTNQYAYDPVHGLRASVIGGESWPVTGGTVTNHGSVQFNSGDGSPLFFNNNGDYVGRTFFTGGSIDTALVRNHLGSLHGSTASLPATGGTQNLSLDATAAHADGLYVVAGTMSGTRPGLSILGADIPLNNDLWFTLSVQAANGAVYPNSWGLLDPNGQASAGFAFPSGFAIFAGTTFHHAFAVIGTSPTSVDFVSEPVSVRLY